MEIVDLTGPLEPAIWRYDASFPALVASPRRCKSRKT